MPLECRLAQKVKWGEVSVAQSCPTPWVVAAWRLCLGILQARILGWVAVLQNLAGRLQRTNAT